MSKSVFCTVLLDSNEGSIPLIVFERSDVFISRLFFAVVCSFVSTFISVGFVSIGSSLLLAGVVGTTLSNLAVVSIVNFCLTGLGLFCSSLPEFGSATTSSD